MTTWDDLTEGDELPVDVLARPQGEPAPESDPDPVPPSDDEGITDPTGSVTVWVDEAYAVVRLRVSNRWRERAEQPLAARMLFAAQQATLGRLFAQPPATGIDPLEPAEPLPPSSLLDRPFDPREVADVLEQTAQAREELAALEARDDVRPTRIVHDEAVGHSPGLRATVVLDHQRRPSAIDLDERWLAGARADQVVESVTAAFADAYAKWREPAVEPGEYAELVTRINALRDRTLRPLRSVTGWMDPRKEQA